MTRIEARIVVRMLGVLLIGLTIAPAWSSVLWLPKVISTMAGLDPTGWNPDWHWPFGFAVRAVFFPACLAFGVALSLRAEPIRRRLFPELEA
jgi:hypothetical protein